MRDQLLDIVQHTHLLDVFESIKVTADPKETKLNSIAEDRSVILEASFHDPIAGFDGVFGFGNLNKLSILLNIPEYKKNADITINRQDKNGVEVPSGLHFENSTGDFKNDYRFMSAEIIQDKIKDVKFKGGDNWAVDFEPSQASIQKMMYQAKANAEEPTFMVRTEDDDLKFYFGDPSTHTGSFVFEKDTGDVLPHELHFPVSQVINIFNLSGDVNLKITSAGAMQIDVDSGLAKYSYILPAQSK